MADVQPFCGLRYDLKQIGHPSTVISPPYDVISPEEQLLYHQRSPYNVIRLEFGLERPTDSAHDNKYLRAAKTLEGWLGQRILVRESRPAFYLIEHRFPYEDTLKGRLSLVARIRLEDFPSGGVRPHETTMRGPAVDRLHLLEACRANFSPIMGLFRHQGEEIRSLFRQMAATTPALSAVDDRGVAYSMWVVTDEESIAKVCHHFADKVLYIADGHHRYETALAYRKQRALHSPYTGGEGFNFVMMSLTDSEDPNLTMFPTHRLVRGLEVETLVQLREGLRHPFYVAELLSPLPTPSETARLWLDSLGRRGRKETTLGLYGLHDRNLCLLGVVEKGELAERMPRDWPPALRDLDVSLLHWVILRRMLGIDSAEQEERCLEYTRDGVEALARVDSGEFQLAFLLNPLPISSVLAVADSGVRMPPKSTYFYPKTPAGLVLNPLWDDQ